jgi:hypothetical protein
MDKVTIFNITVRIISISYIYFNKMEIGFCHLNNSKSLICPPYII